MGYDNWKWKLFLCGLIPFIKWGKDNMAYSKTAEIDLVIAVLSGLHI